MNFEYEVTSIPIPADAVFIVFADEQAFMIAALKLLRTGHTFVTSSKHGQIMLSQEAARMIGVL